MEIFVGKLLVERKLLKCFFKMSQKEAFCCLALAKGDLSTLHRKGKWLDED